MSTQMWLFMVLALMAIGRMVRRLKVDPLKPNVTPPRRAKPRVTKPSAIEPPLVLRAQIYMPAGFLAALDRADRLDEQWASLPDGERAPELEMLLEWIANAKPGEVLEIISEIKRHYYNTGDKDGGDAMKRALRQSLKATSLDDREAILRRYEPYTRQARIPYMWVQEAEPRR